MSAPLPPRQCWLAVGGLVFNAFTWGVSWWPFRQLGEHGLHALWLTGFIYALAVAVLLLARPGALADLLQRRRLWWLVLAAGATNACFIWAVSIGDVVRVVLLFYLRSRHARSGLLSVATHAHCGHGIR